MTSTFLPSHIEVDYDDAEHRYFKGTTLYRSSTQIVEQFTNKFDVKTESIAMADRHGMTPEYWANKWKLKNTNSLVRGNIIHGKEEADAYKAGRVELNGKTFPVRSLYPGTQYIYKHLLDGTYPELKLWRHDWKIAGRTDKATIETPCITRYMHIEDYKSNEYINSHSFKDKNGYRMMKGPLSHLMDCNLEHYTLQLSLYQFMAEYFGFRPGIRRIIHHPAPIEGLSGVPKVEYKELPYYKKEVIAMLEYLRQHKWLSV